MEPQLREAPLASDECGGALQLQGLPVTCCSSAKKRDEAHCFPFLAFEGWTLSLSSLSPLQNVPGAGVLAPLKGESREWAKQFCGEKGLLKPELDAPRERARKESGHGSPRFTRTAYLWALRK